MLDPHHGQSLRSVVTRARVWVVESPANRPVMEALWNERRHERAPHDVTLFRRIDGLTPADHVAAVLRSIHRTATDDGSPSLSVLEVIGGVADQEMLRVIGQLGLQLSRVTADGFLAHALDGGARAALRTAAPGSPE